jgi:tripartite-type tricarboxylate transporter receptor subunit TctC
MNRRWLSLALAGLALIVLLAAPGQAGAQVVAQTTPQATPQSGGEDAFFRGKTVRILVGSPPGGGYDLYARMLAPHMARRLGATVIVENKPGASALLALSYMLVQPADGLTTMLASAEAAIMSELLAREGVTWNVAKLNWLALVGSSPKLWFVGGKSRITSAADALKTEQLIWPATGPADNISDVASIVSHVIGLKSKIITGYKGAGDMSLAVVRGEADAGVLSVDTAIKLVQSGQVRPIAMLDERRWPGLPEVPTLAQAAPIDPAKEWLSRLRNEIGEVQRAMVTAPGVPLQRVAFMRRIMHEMLTDPELIAEGARSGREIGYRSGEELQKMIVDMVAVASPRVPEFRKVVLETYFQGGGR